MTDPEAAWATVHEHTPKGSYVGRPGYEERYDQWSVYAFHQSATPIVGKRSRELTAVGRTGLACVKEVARCLGELPEGRWPD